jgi:hypothetical protein
MLLLCRVLVFGDTWLYQIFAVFYTAVIHTVALNHVFLMLSLLALVPSVGVLILKSSA